MFDIRKSLFCGMLIAAILFSSHAFGDQDSPLEPEITSVIGELVISASDNFETGISQLQYAIDVKQTDGSYRTFALKFETPPSNRNFKSGDRIAVSGLLSGRTIEVESVNPAMAALHNEIQNTADNDDGAPLVAGARKAIVISLNIKGVGSTHDIPDPDAAMYTGNKNVNELYKASSYKQLWFNPDTDGDGQHDVFGPYEIEDDTTDDTECSYLSWAEAADDMAKQNGVNLSLYQHRVYLLPMEAGCGWAGYGNVGCHKTRGCRAWVISNGPPAIAHELGHNLGWRHSTYDKNGDGIIENSLDEEYGDHSGIMGMPHWAQANAPHRDQMEWFKAFPGSLIEAACSDTHALRPLEQDARNAKPQVIKIPIGATGEFYYVSYRRQIGNYPSHKDYANKINIHRYVGNGRFRTELISTLGVGQTFNDNRHKISVTWQGSPGNTDYKTATARISMPTTAPTANFSSTAEYLKVQFKDLSDDDDAIATHEWEFGDGKSSDAKDPEHVYEKGGKFLVKLTVWDKCGDSDSVTKQVSVTPNSPPQTDFSFTVNNLNVKFTDNSKDDDGGIVSRLWDFGDGDNSSDVNPTHAYDSEGTYSVKLTVTDTFGDKTTSTQQVVANAPVIPAKANFTFTAGDLSVRFTDASTGTLASHLWDFGDGNTATKADPAHVYADGGTYTVKLTVTDANGGKDTLSKDVTVTSPEKTVSANFTHKATDQKVQFTDASVGNIPSRQWNFGDGNTSTETNPVHEYENAGTYTVKLTVTDDKGDQDTAVQEVTVEASVQPADATANFTFTVNGRTVQFTDTSAGAISSRQWDFGDGNTADETNPEHTYAGAGTYTVTLTIKDKGDNTKTTTQEVTVTDNQAPSSDYEFKVDGMTLSLTQKSKDEDGTIQSYHWDFGDGTTSSEANPKHVYEASGDYKVRLTVTDDGGAKTVEEKAISIESSAIKPDKNDAKADSGGGGGGGGGGCFIDTL